MWTEKTCPTTNINEIKGNNTLMDVNDNKKDMVLNCWFIVSLSPELNASVFS